MSRFFSLMFWVSFGFAIVASPSRGADPAPLAKRFQEPPRSSYPETWFHLIGGNVDRAALSKDLEAVSAAGIRGIQLFHGRGRPWPGVEPQIETLSPTWDGLIRHVGDQAARLDLKFTMQNCPGWAMSGGPWITPDKAMRHLVTSRMDVEGGRSIAVELALPQPSAEDWRDYRDVAVLAFPTPRGDTGRRIVPDSIRSSLASEPWGQLVAGEPAKVQLPARGDTPNWVELTFANPVTLRSIELPPIENLMKRFCFDPDSSVLVFVAEGEQWRELVAHPIPRGNWQDRQEEMAYVLAVPDARSRRYRIVFENNRAMELSRLRLSTAARLQDWRAQAGYALRSLERSPPPVQANETWVRRSQIVDLSGRFDSSGRLEWDAPEGPWTILRFGHVNTGVKNKPAPPEATGFECDKLSTAGADQHFAGYIGRLTGEGGAAGGGRLQGMLIDSWECYTQTWTPEMEQEFVDRRGYALRRWLPALAGWVVDDHRSSERFLRDWRATISDLIAENYYGRLAELGRSRGLELSFETAVGDVSPGDILQYFRSADVPMCEVWKPNDPHVGGLETKPIAPTVSAARLYGKPRVAAEAFTSAPMNWKEHPFELKNVADRSFALGITHLVFHTYTHNPLNRLPGTSFGNTIGTPFLRGQTWWRFMPQFTDYLARCGFMLEQGRPVSDVLWYLGDDLDHKPRQDSPFPAGYQFDYLNADALLHRLSVDNGDFLTPEGVRWKALWLAPAQCRRLTPATLRRIQELLMQGGVVIGGPPEMNPSLTGGQESEQGFRTLVGELWGEGRASSTLKGDRKIGKGRLVWGESLRENLVKLGIRPDVQGTLSERWCHRRIGNMEVYFVTAGRTEPLDATLQFRTTGTPEFWNPIDGSRRPAEVFHSTDSGTAVALSLPAAGSTFIVFRPGSKSTGPRQMQWTKIRHEGITLRDATDLSRVDTTAGYPVHGIDRYGICQPWVDPPDQVIAPGPDGRCLVAYKNGVYRFHNDAGEQREIVVRGARKVPLASPWRLEFPADGNSPVSIPEAITAVDLDRLKPWSELDSTARFFSGTAVYTTKFALGLVGTESRVQLDLGRVGDIAEIFLNGMQVDTLWSPPFRRDITESIREGENELSVRVTNTWHNRLRFDSGLPRSRRKTWTFGYPSEQSPLTFAGIGPGACLNVGEVISFAGLPPVRPPTDAGHAAPVAPPPGRLAIVADGNSPDPDDIGATAVIFGLLRAAGLQDRLVHLSHSCDLKPTSRISVKDELRRQEKLTELCRSGIARFGPMRNIDAALNCRTHQQAAVEDLRDAINASSTKNPLWIIEAGEPDLIGFALSAAEVDKRRHVHVVSHHPANDNAGDYFTWQQVLDFGVVQHQIGDQNIGLQTGTEAWDWAKAHSSPDIRWIWRQLAYAERDGVVKFQSNKFDCSDAGMIYWWITGADRGGNAIASPLQIRELLTGEMQ